MGIGIYTDFKIYDEEFQGGQYEVLARNLNVFNAASGNALRMVSQEMLGHYRKEAFFKDISSLITRRDISSVSSVSDLKMTQGELISVKVNKKIGPVAQTLDAMRKIGMTDQEISYVLGKIVAEHRLKNMVDSAVMAVEAAIENIAANNVTWSSVKLSGDPSTACHKGLITTLSKMGDVSSRIICWVMHSKCYFDLLQQTLVDKIVNVANVTIYEGTVATLGRPTVVVDAAALKDDNGSLTDTYNILGLQTNAVVATESEEGGLVSQVVTGLENLAVRFQGEYAYNLECLGMQWDTASGGINPTDAALATKTNWDKAVTDDKDTPGVRLVVE